MEPTTSRSLSNGHNHSQILATVLKLEHCLILALLMQPVLATFRFAAIRVLFCSTSLPITSTRWFIQCIQAFPIYKKCHRLISAITRIQKNSWEHRESNPGLLGEKRELFHCAMQPPTLPIRVFYSCAVLRRNLMLKNAAIIRRG